ncbi:methyltransferase domain-containing protein [Streptomyces sp. NPDC046831]|uniref:class I SAM-dependent methyltransferase n=1 Tax=Streptomyces sp. NPDC046831 TaxID=3154805 RepID=UPI0033D302AD
MADAPGFHLRGSDPERYEQYAAPLTAPFVTAALDAVDLYPGATVLDLACGTGITARAAAAQVGPSGRVFGADVDEGMLEVARARHPRLYPDIEFTAASADALPYSDAAFDAVVCLQGAQFLPDPDAALTETARVLRPGGRCALTVWADRSRSPYFDALHDVIEQYAGPEAAAEHASLFSCSADRLTTALRTAGLREVAAHDTTSGITLSPLADFTSDHLSALPWARQITKNRGPQALAAAGRALADRLADRLAPDGSATLPFTAVLVTAVR